DHSPFLQAILRAVQPKRTTADYPRFDVLRFLVRARAMIVGFGILAVASAALLAFRIVRRPSTPAIVAAALAGSRWPWHRALSDLRNDPPTLALFWAGALLLLWDREQSPRAALRAGVGIGFIGVAALWNPKWPLASLLLGGLFLTRLISYRRAQRPG